jgi:hypothetical protein
MSDISSYYDKYEDKSRPLANYDIPAIMLLLLDRLGVTEFEFTIQELLDKGAVSMECENLGNGNHVLRKLTDG